MFSSPARHVLPGLCLLWITAGTATAGAPDDATLVQPLAAGTLAPTVEVRRPDGSAMQLGPTSLEGPAVLIFYRGGWCPYCNAHLAALRNAESELISLGFDVMFLSADRPELLHSSLKEPGIRYTLLSDARMNAARAYGVAFRVDDATVARYKEHGIDLEAASGERHHELPVPAVFILDARGVIRFVHADPDYKQRISATDLLAAARRALDP